MKPLYKSDESRFDDSYRLLRRARKRERLCRESTCTFGHVVCFDDTLRRLMSYPSTIHIVEVGNARLASMTHVIEIADVRLTLTRLIARSKVGDARLGLR